MNKMTALLSAFALTAFTAAGAFELPPYYEEVPTKAPSTKLFVNKETSAFIAVSILKNENHDDALEAMKKILKDLHCDSPVKGDKVISSAETCVINAVIVDLGIIATGDKLAVFQTNSHVSDQEFQIFLKNFMPDMSATQQEGTSEPQPAPGAAGK